MIHKDAILYALKDSTPNNPITGTELRKRLEFAGYKFINEKVFYNSLAELKKQKLIGGSMINKKRCYWSVKPEIVHIQDIDSYKESDIADILDGNKPVPKST